MTFKISFLYKTIPVVFIYLIVSQISLNGQTQKTPKYGAGKYGIEKYFDSTLETKIILPEAKYIGHISNFNEVAVSLPLIGPISVKAWRWFKNGKEHKNRSKSMKYSEYIYNDGARPKEEMDLILFKMQENMSNEEYGKIKNGSLKDNGHLVILVKSDNADKSQSYKHGGAYDNEKLIIIDGDFSDNGIDGLMHFTIRSYITNELLSFDYEKGKGISNFKQEFL